MRPPPTQPDLAPLVGALGGLARRFKLADTPTLDADDLVQAALLRLHRRAGEHDPAKMAWRSWALVTGFQAMQDELRRVNGRRGDRPLMVSVDEPVPGTDDLHLEDLLAAPGEDDGDVLAREALYRRIDTLLTDLERNMLSLRLDEEWTMEEIAEVFGVSASRMSQHWKRAMNRLARDAEVQAAAA